MDIGGYLRVFRERWIAILLCLFLGVNAAIAITALTTPNFQASALLFLRVDSDSGTLFDRSQFSVQRVQSYPDLVDSPDVLNPVIKDLKLHTTPQQLAEKISATNPVDTVSLQVTAQAAQASLAAQLANSVSKHLSQEVQKLESVNRSGSSSIELALTVPAQPPRSPQSPNALVNIAIGVVGGLSAGLILAILMSLMSPAVRTAESIRRATRLPVLAQLPTGSRGWRGAGLRDAAEGDAEAYDDAMISLQRFSIGRLLEFLVLVPVSPGDAGDVLRLKLARAAAEAGRAVCVLETDQRSNVSLPFPPEDASLGMSEVLAGKVRLGKALVHVASEKFAILPAGEIDAGRPPQVSSRSFGALVDELRDDFDLLIAQSTVRSRPVEVSALASSADTVVIVAEFGKTRADDLGRLVSQLEAVDIHPLGVVLVAVPRWGRVAVPETSRPDGIREAQSPGFVRTVAMLARPARV